MPFQKLGLHPSLVRNTISRGYQTPTPVQAQAIPEVLAGRDLIATAQTGTGKTAAFLLPVLHHLMPLDRGIVRALIITPTRELAQQIEQVYRGLGAGTGLRATLIIGGVPAGPQERALRTGVEIVIATPGRLLDHLRSGIARLDGVKTLILDEADQMFDMGFLPDIKRIIERLPVKRQTLLFSATMPPEIAKLSAAILRDPRTITVGTQGAATPTVTQTAYPVATHRKTALLEELLDRLEMPSVLIFTRTKHGAKKLTRSLTVSGHRVAELHSNRTPTQRAKAMHDFRTKRVPILVATNIAARGIDVSHVTHVINFEVPPVAEEYVHRIGRTGRAEAEGDAFVLVAPEEERTLIRIERQLGLKIPRQRLEDFDYGAPAPRPVAARPAPGRRPVAGAASAAGSSQFKPYRRQGRR